MTNLVNKIKTDTVTAMKNKETAKLSTLRLLVAELEKEKVQLKLSDVSMLTDEKVQAVITRQIKKLDKEIESYVTVGRKTESQESEKELLASYLPKQLTEEELLVIVKQVAVEIEGNTKKIGQAMKSIAERVGVSADKGLASLLLRQEIKKMEEHLKNQK